MKYEVTSHLSATVSRHQDWNEIFRRICRRVIVSIVSTFFLGSAKGKNGFRRVPAVVKSIRGRDSSIENTKRRSGADRHFARHLEIGIGLPSRSSTKT
jgi:hypothetical protein